MTARHEGLAQGPASCSPLKKVSCLPSPDPCRMTGSPFLLTGWESWRAGGRDISVPRLPAPAGSGGVRDPPGATLGSRNRGRPPPHPGANSAVGMGECGKHGAGQEPTGAELGGGQDSSPVPLGRAVCRQESTGVGGWRLRPTGAGWLRGAFLSGRPRRGGRSGRGGP